jgi:alpha-beta hydrolase superfamily lysophospholipase
MPHAITQWKTKDGLSLFAQSWTVESPKAVLGIIHGMGEHSSRYAHMAKAMNAAGISVVAYDHRGHGKSGGKKGHMDSIDQLLDGVDQLLGEMAKLAPGAPQFLFGHSMGGNVLLNHALRRRPNVKGIIASGAYLRLAFAPPAIQVALAKLVKGILPALGQPTNLDATAISRDAKVVDAYLKDPLVHGRITPAFFVEIDAASRYAMEHASELKLPLLIYHGSADRLTSHDASEEFARKVKGDVTWRSWSGLFHECHNEPEQNDVFRMVSDWILARS